MNKKEMSEYIVDYLLRSSDVTVSNVYNCLMKNEKIPDTNTMGEVLANEIFNAITEYFSLKQISKEGKL